jgi:hypothetical protein
MFYQKPISAQVYINSPTIKQDVKALFKYSSILFYAAYMLLSP